MPRVRALVGAVPHRAWTAVVGLALLASFAVAAVIGAGLSVWRSAVGSTAQAPLAIVEPPSSGLVVLPGGQSTRTGAPPHPTAPHPTAPHPTAPHVTGSGQAGPHQIGPVTTGTPTTRPPTGTPTTLTFTPHLLAAGGGTTASDEDRARAKSAAHAAHLRHEVRMQHKHVAKAHRAKHAKPGRHHPRHAARGHGHGHED